MIPRKDTQLHTFSGGMDSDTAPELMPPNSARYMLNVRHYTTGDKGLITNVKGNTIFTMNLPSGENHAHGYGEDEEENKFYFIVYNSNGYHTIYVYDDVKASVYILLQSITDSNGVDILKLNKDYLINHVDIIPGPIGKLFTCCDGYNKAVKFNISKALDKSSTGYGLIIFEDFIRAYKQAPVDCPLVAYTTDATRNSNFLYGKLFKFCYRFLYDDGEQSNWSDWSPVALPPNQSYSGLTNITYDNNCIMATIETGNQLVIKIEVAMKVGSLDFVTTAILDKVALKITDNSSYTFKFYNDGADRPTDQGKIFRQFSTLPNNPFCQAFVKNAMTYTRFSEGFAPVAVNISVSVSYADIFLPDGTANQLNVPAFICTLITNGYTSGSAGINKRFNVQERFEIGFDVKAGNKFQLFGQNGQSANFNFSYTATSADTATTIANKVKSWLRGIGRGIPDAHNGISDETVDGSGNVLFTFTILGFWNESPIRWSGYVNPVSFESLLNDGLSIQLIKPGSTRKYAVAYCDDDGRKGNANTSDACVVYSGFVTEVGDLKRAVHTMNIYHQPPSWAKYYYILRTPDSGPWIEVLIQKVINVDPDPTQIAAGNNDKYLDLVVGSLFTYQKLHPNTVLKYDFEKGDRVRLIKSYDPITHAKTLYPYWETEVLSYSIDTEETVNEAITLNGTDIVTIAGVANPDYIGKTLTVTNAISAYPRTIIGVPAGNQYALDEAYIEGTIAAPVSYSSFIISDHRGIVRIKKPANITVLDLSLVELYKPQLNTVDGYKQFFAFGLKLPIGNYGTASAYHAGTVQNQYATGPSDPAIINIVEGDAYNRNRELPTNNSVPGTQLLVDHITDPNFSDTYESDLNDLGRVFPQDDGSGVQYFGSRVRFSNNFIQGTKINGLSDFDNLDREDYNDPYGDIQLTKFMEGRLLVFKPLKTGYLQVLGSILTDEASVKLIGTTKKLLSQMQYYAWEGGIGRNPESYFSNGNYKYFASTNSGAFMRLAGDGCEPISALYNFDKDAKQVLSIADKFKLRIFGGFDRENKEAIWAIEAYNNYLYKGGFVPAEWNVNNDALPDGTTFQINQQPAHGSVSIDGSGNFAIVAGDVLGDDYFVYQAILPGGALLPARKECFTVVQAPNRPMAFQPRSSTTYCVVRNHGFQVRASSAYCITRASGFRVRSSSAYCVTRPVGFRMRSGSVYCLQSAVIPLDNFDFMVLRYIWTTGSGIDLDSFTGLINTGTIYDGNPTTRAGWVGYAQNPNPGTGSPDSGSRVIPYGSTTPYLNWGTDNTTGNGIEAILVDLKQFIHDFPATPSPVSVKMNAVWYNTKESGNITVEVTTYLGGTMSLDPTTHNFINSGGVVVDTIDIPVTLNIQSRAALITSSQAIARMDYDKTTNTATLTLI